MRAGDSPGPGMGYQTGGGGQRSRAWSALHREIYPSLSVSGLKNLVMGPDE